MGDGGDQGQDTDEFTSDAELDQIARDAEAVQGGRSNIVGSSSYDAQFTADNLEARGLPPENFMSAANFAQTRQGGAGGDDITSTPEDFIDSTGISVPSIQAASSTLAPGILGETLSDFQSGVRPDTGRRPMGFDTPANEMLEAAIGTTARIPNVSRETLVDRSGQIFPSMTTGAGLQTLAGNVAGLKGSTQNLADAINFGTGFPDEVSARRVDDPRFIDFGVVDQRAPGTGVSTVGDDFGPALDMVDARTQGASIVGDDFGPALDMVDARTTATGAFDPDAIMEEEEKFATLPGTTLEDIERLYTVPVGQRKAGPGTDPTFLQGMGVPSFLSGFGDFIERTSRDRLAARLAKGDVEEKNIVRNANGLVIGIKDAQGNLIEGIDPDAMMQDTGNGGDQPQRRVAPKAPTDPCPDGYQLIDGKCTPTGATDTGTGFMMFPADRTPPFRTGPFTPTTVATTPNIRALNPVTFGLSNIFRR